MSTMRVRCRSRLRALSELAMRHFEQAASGIASRRRSYLQSAALLLVRLWICPVGPEGFC
jgi:hypothetical protein